MRNKRNKRILAVGSLFCLILFTGTVFSWTVEKRCDPVKSITTINTNCKSMDWHHGLNLIAYGKMGPGGYYDVFVSNSDGSGETCLTAEKPDCPQKHNGNPAWHPSGDYIVFTAENPANPDIYKQWAMPGTGFNCNLWVMTSDGDDFYQLTDYAMRIPFRGVIHPQFSHAGDRLFWSERVRQGDSFGGGWVLKMADFVETNTGPRLENIKTCSPGEESCFYESHAFSVDDSRILFSGNLIQGQPSVGLDLYELEPATGELTRLTMTDEDWDEHAHYSPDGSRIAWMSSTGFDIQWGDISGHNWKKYLVTELWIMDSDGSNKERLTYFNTEGHPEYRNGRRCVISDSSWGPDGKSIVALLAYEGWFGRLLSEMILIELE